MKVTIEMIQAARRGEYDYYQRGRKLGTDRFIPTPDTVIRAMLEAALAPVHNEDQPMPKVRKAPAAESQPVTIDAAPRKVAIVTARKPRPRR